jgi:hypothetical protein
MIIHRHHSPSDSMLVLPALLPALSPTLLEAMRVKTKAAQAVRIIPVVRDAYPGLSTDTRKRRMRLGS